MLRRTKGMNQKGNSRQKIGTKPAVSLLKLHLEKCAYADESTIQRPIPALPVIFKPLRFVVVVEPFCFFCCVDAFLTSVESAIFMHHVRNKASVVIGTAPSQSWWSSHVCWLMITLQWTSLKLFGADHV